jgi:hypothetical protein
LSILCASSGSWAQTRPQPLEPSDSIAPNSEVRRPGRLHARFGIGGGRLVGSIERDGDLPDSDISGEAISHSVDLGAALTTELALGVRTEGYYVFDSSIPDGSGGQPSETLMLVGLLGPAIDYRIARGFVLDFAAGAALQSNGDLGFIDLFGRGASENSAGVGVSSGAIFEGHIGRGWHLGAGGRLFAMPWSTGRYDGHDSNDIDEHIAARLFAMSVTFVAAYN